MYACTNLLQYRKQRTDFILVHAKIYPVEPRFNEPLYKEVPGITNDNSSPARPKLQ